MEKLRDHLDYYYTVKGYNCAETVFRAANDAWGLGLKDPVFKCMGGFGGGMGTRSVCGAVSGGIAAMGFLYVEETGHKSPLMMAKAKLLTELVQQRLGSEKCSYLNPTYKTEEEKCLPTIRLVCEIIDEVVTTEIQL